VIRTFWLMVSVLLCLLAGVGVHYLRFDPAEITRPLEGVAMLTGCTGPSLGRAYYEISASCTPHRMYLSNIAYPEMDAIDRMDFVYVE